MDRDALLAAALGTAVLTGCTTSRRDPAPTPSPTTPSPTPVDPDLATLRTWWTAEIRLSRAYARASREIRPLGANHAARAAAVADHLRVRRAPLPARPAARALSRAALRTAERRLAADLLADLAGVRDPLVATLGAELAAGARQHATLLGLLP